MLMAEFAWSCAFTGAIRCVLPTPSALSSITVRPVADMMVIFTLLGACPAEFSFERMDSLIDNHNGWMERHGEEVRRGAEVTLSEEGRQPPE